MYPPASAQGYRQRGGYSLARGYAAGTAFFSQGGFSLSPPVHAFERVNPHLALDHACRTRRRKTASPSAGLDEPAPAPALAPKGAPGQPSGKLVRVRQLAWHTGLSDREVRLRLNSSDVRPASKRGSAYLYDEVLALHALGL